MQEINSNNLPQYAYDHSIARSIDLDKYYFDLSAAEEVILFIESFATITKSAEFSGDPLMLDNWQKEMLGNIYGWKRKSNGYRKYREAFIFMPRKQGKTSLSSALVLYHMVTEEQTEAYILASSAAQAGIGLDITKLMVMQNPQLKELIHPFRSELRLPTTNSKFKAVPAEADGLHGANASFVIVDEYHSHRDSEARDVMLTSMVTRPNRLAITITTAGFNMERPCYFLYERAKKINSGDLQDDSFYAEIYESNYEAPEGVNPDEWDEFSDYEMELANPRWSNSETLREYLREARVKALNSTEDKMRFRVLHMNKWTNSLAQFFDMDNFRQGKLNSDQLERLKGMDCIVGIDIAQTRDLTAAVAIFWEGLGTKDEAIIAIPFIWLPDELVAENSRRDGVNYSKWKDEGHLLTTQGNYLDQAAVEAKVRWLDQEYNVIGVAMDKWNSDRIMTNLSLDGFKVVEIPQSIAVLSYPTKYMEGLVQKGKFFYEDNPLYTWSASNVICYMDASANIRIDKSKVKYKIDPIAATVNAVALLQTMRSDLEYNSFEINVI